MTQIEGGGRPGRYEAAFNAGRPGGAYPSDRREGNTPPHKQLTGGEVYDQQTHHSAEKRILSLVSTTQRQEGAPLDPYQISDKLLSYQDQVVARTRGVTFIQKSDEPFRRVIPTRTPTEEDNAFVETITRVRDAFDIDAFSHFPEGYQQTLSEEVYDKDVRVHSPDDSFTLTGEEKAILRKIKALAGLPDDPEQRAYTYGSIPNITETQ